MFFPALRLGKPSIESIKYSGSDIRCGLHTLLRVIELCIRILPLRFLELLEY